MDNYLVISYDDDRPNDVFFDTLLAESLEIAEEEVRRVRGEAVNICESYLTKDFAKLVSEWAAETPEQTKESWDLTRECYCIDEFQNG